MVGHTFGLLLRTHLLYFRRQWHVAFLTTLLQPLAFLLFAYLRVPFSISPKTYVAEPTYHHMKFMEHMIEELKLYYAPKVPATEKIMLRIKKHFKPVDLQGFETESQLLAKIHSLEDYVGVVFDSPFDRSNATFPTHLQYRIRTRMYPKSLTSSMSAHEWPFRATAKEVYFSRFLGVQFAVDMSFMRAVTAGGRPTPDVQLSLQEMPYPPHDKYSYSVYFNYYVFLLFLLTNGVQVFFFTFAMAQETYSGMKHMLQGMGMCSWMYWSKWGLHCVTPQLVSTSLVMMSLKYDMPASEEALLANSDGLLILFTLLCYMLALTTTCFLLVVLSVFVAKRTSRYMVCAGLALLFWYLHPTVLLFVSYNNRFTHQVLKHLILLFPNVCFFLGIFVVAQYEQMGGISWAQMFTGVSTLTSYPSIGCLAGMLLFDALLYFLLAWYLSQVLAWQYSVNLPWHFPLHKSYWVKARPTEEVAPALERSPIMEEPATELLPIIQIRHLNKAFGEARQLVTDLNIDIYEHQLTVILGRDKIGKSTIVDMISGFVKPTSGRIYLDQRRLSHDLEQTRKHIGFCPDRNVLLPYLTIQEHVLLYGQLRGLSYGQALHEGKHILLKLNLSKRASVMTGKLPKSIHHRICLAAALVGSGQLVVLDEPTWQMSPETKREFWDYLIHLKKRCTVIITLSDVQEAEILADKILLMHDDRMLCYGSMRFIEHYFQTGYMLHVFLHKSFDIIAITNIIRDLVPNAGLTDFYSGRVIFSLASATSTAMAEMLYYLDVHKSRLGISHFKVSILSIDQVFQRAEDYVDRFKHMQIRAKKSETTPAADGPRASGQEPKQLEFGARLIQQYKGLFAKRYYYMKHKWVYHLFAFLLPIVYESSVGYLLRAACGPPENTTIILDIGSYAGSVTLYSSSSDSRHLGSCYAEVLRHRGQSAECRHVSNVSEAIIEYGTKDKHFYHGSLIVAAELNRTGANVRVNALYGNLAQHGPPISLNLADEALLKNVSNNTNYKITVVNNPLPKMEEDNFELFNLRTVLLCSMLGTVMGILVHQLYEEQLGGFRDLQLMAGVSRLTFWCTQFTVDMAFCMLSQTIALVITYYSDKSPLSVHRWHSCQVFGVMLLLFTMSHLPFCYICCIYFRRYFIAVALMSSYSKIGLLLHQMTIRFYRTHSTLVACVAGILPSYAYAIGTFNCLQQSYHLFMWDRQDENMVRARCAVDPDLPCCDPHSYACDKFKNFLLNDDILMAMYALLCNFVLYVSLLFVIDCGVLRRIKWMYRRRHRVACSQASVRATRAVDNEGARVWAQLHGGSVSDQVLLADVGKWRGERRVLTAITFGVHAGECLGLLGKHHAGKSVLLRTIAGLTTPDTGDRHICGMDMRVQLSRCQRQIGYCSQSDALLFPLTARQLIKCFAYMRGVHSKEIDSVVSRWVYQCELDEWCDLPVERYSFGAVRLVNVALALVAAPPVALLDEPASGVGPAAREKLWSVIASMRQQGQAVVLATRNIEECEMLCNRMAVLISGRIRCMGELQYLRDKYAVGLTAIIKFRQLCHMRLAEVCDDISAVSSKFQKKFKCTVREQNMSLLHYNVCGTNTNLAELFVYMEGLKHAYQHIIEDYVISNTSLEHVFMSLTHKES